MRIVFLALLVALPGAVTPISAQSIDESTPESIVKSVLEGFDRFALWNACEPIYLDVGYPNDDAVKMSLTPEAIATAVRSRLRAARLYRSSEIDPYLPYLSVRVTTLSGTRITAYSLSLEFKRLILDPKLNEKGLATTWDRRVVGQGDAAYILSSVSQLTDKFIDEYLRVNESACSRSPIDP